MTVKVQFRKLETGRRTSIMLSDALVQTWEQASPGRSLADFLAGVTQGDYQTFQQAAEAAMLRVVQERIREG